VAGESFLGICSRSDILTEIFFGDREQSELFTFRRFELLSDAFNELHALSFALNLVEVVLVLIDKVDNEVEAHVVLRSGDAQDILVLDFTLDLDIVLNVVELLISQENEAVFGSSCDMVDLGNLASSSSETVSLASESVSPYWPSSPLSSSPSPEPQPLSLSSDSATTAFLDLGFFAGAPWPWQA